jgi:hypothetical protein
MTNRAVNLEFKYAIINLSTGECLACMTFSYEIVNDAYIPVPHADDDYVGLYYNQQDGIWYEDSGFTVVAEGFN